MYNPEEGVGYIVVKLIHPSIIHLLTPMRNKFTTTSP
jgi:hypothetical protein